MKNKIGIVKDKKTDILGLWKNFINGTPQELTQEESILKDQSISEADKKILLQSLKDEEKFANKIFKYYYKTMNVKSKNNDIPKVEIDSKGKQRTQDSIEKTKYEHNLDNNDREH